MKKLISVLLTLCILLGLCACGNSGSGENDQPQTAALTEPGGLATAVLAQDSRPLHLCAAP